MDERLRESVEEAENVIRRIKPEYVQAIKLLQNLAKEYLKVAGKMPAELKYTTDKNGYAEKTSSYVAGYNQARQDCILAVQKLASVDLKNEQCRSCHEKTMS